MYASERLCAAQTSWAQLLDDSDISQFLPLSEEDFAAGVSFEARLAVRFAPTERVFQQRDYPFEIRQRLASPNCLLSHPPLLTSPFSLLIKAINLLSQVKAFNVRFKNKHADDLPGPVDPRSTDEFKELDDVIGRFKASWPKEYKDGGVKEDGKVEPSVYLATMLPSVSVSFRLPVETWNSVADYSISEQPFCCTIPMRTWARASVRRRRRFKRLLDR